MKVGWDASHGEFLITDYYYYSKLKKYAESRGIKIDAVTKFSRLGNYDVIVFNYPEMRFKVSEIKMLRRWIRDGKKVVFAGYYNDFDDVNSNINRTLSKLGIEIKLNNDIVRDKPYYEDVNFPIAEYNGLKVVMPCSSSVEGEAILKTKNYCLAAKQSEVIVIGTCVFWDNYSIDLMDNKEFSLLLLSGEI